MSIVFITDIASPHMVEFAKELNKISNFHMLCLEKAIDNRDKYWETDTSYKYIKVLPKVLFKSTSKIFKSRYYVYQLNHELNIIRPKTIIVSGFSKIVSFQSIKYAKKNKIDLFVWTERSRNKRGISRKRGVFWRIIKIFFSNIKGVLVTAEDIIPQFRRYGFSTNQIIYCPYPVHIEPLLACNRKIKSNKKKYNIIFPNRLTDIYNPKMVIEIIIKLIEDNYNVHFYLNKSGEEYQNIFSIITQKKLSKHVTFIELKDWKELHQLYLGMDIMVLPAKFSNGNFTILECMASSVGIVISNKVLGVGKEIKNNQNGFRVDVELESFIEAITAYINSPYLLKNHTMINKRIVKKFSPIEVARMFKNITAD